MTESLFSVQDDWDCLTLAESVGLRGSIQTGPFGSQLHASDYVASGVPTVMPANIGDNRILPNGIAQVREADAQRLSKHRLVPGDIVYSRRGDVERRALVREDERGWLCGTGSLRIRFGDDSGVDPRFASYYLGHPAVREYVVRHAVGATMANLNTAILGAVPFVRPPIRTQTAIAGVLGALDDKIECNQRLARYCSDLAAAETEGHLARGFRESSRARLSDIASTHKGVSYRSEDLRPGPNALVTLKSVSRIGEYQPEGLKPYTGKFKTDQVVIPGDIVVAQTDLTQAAEVIGRAVRVPVASGVETLVASLDLVIVRPTLPGLTREYLYCLLARDDFRYHCRGFANGTTVLHMAGGSIEKYPLDLPSEEEIAEHTAVVKPLLEAAESHLKQNATLRELRDALLPKLLSGEIRVEDAEEQVEDAV